MSLEATVVALPPRSARGESGTGAPRLPSPTSRYDESAAPTPIDQAAGASPSDWVIWRTLIDLTDTLDITLHEHLQRLCCVAVQLIDAFEAAAVAADPSGALSTVVASSERTRVFAEREIELAEGPTMACYRHGETVRCPDTYTASHWWPRLTPAIHEAGIAAIHAVPLWHRSRTFGALTLYSAWPGTIDPASDDLACALTDAATVGMLQLRRAHHPARDSDYLHPVPEQTAPVQAVESERHDSITRYMEAVIARYDEAQRHRTGLPRLYEEQLRELRRSRGGPD